MKLISDKRVISIIVALALFMDALDATIINTAIPAMSRSLHIHPIDLKIALISYLLALAIFIPASGWISDRFGIKRVFLFALSTFTLSSLWCGFAQNIVHLVLARSLQGLGGALMLPLGRLIILRTYPRHQVVQAMNMVIMIVSLGLMLGPFAGGFITYHFSWHWIFWVNIPVGIFVILLAVFWLEDYPPDKGRRFDILGFILFGGGLAAFTFYLSALSESNAKQVASSTILVISLLMLAGYFVWFRYSQQAIINLNLLKIRTFRVSVVANLFARVGIGAIPFLLPLLLQIELGFTPQLSGLLLVPIALGVLVVKSVSLKILQWFGYKHLLLGNTIFVALSVWSFQLIGYHTATLFIAALTFLFGFFISLQYSGMNSLAYAEIPTEILSSATSIVSTTQQLGQSFGVALGALLLRFFSPTFNAHLTVNIFQETFFAMGIVVLISGIIFLQLKPNDGEQMLFMPSKDALEE